MRPVHGARRSRRTMVGSARGIRQRLAWADGRTRRSPRRAARPAGLPAADRARPAVVDADPGPGAAGACSRWSRGEAWVIAGRPASRSAAAAGDVAIARGPDAYMVADDPATAAAGDHPPGRAAAPRSYGEDLAEAMDLGVRTWGNSRDGGTVMLVGTYSVDRRGQRPAAARAAAAAGASGATAGTARSSPLLGDEITATSQGQAAVLDRLLDLLLIAALRAWFARPEAERAGLVPGAGRPGGRPRAAAAARPPGAPVDGRGAGREVGVSRAALARRFTELVGEPPMAYLTGVAAGARRRPAARAGRDARRGGPAGRLQQRVRAERRVQAGARVSPQACRAAAGGSRRRRRGQRARKW